MSEPVFNHYPTLSASNSYYSVKSVLAKVREAIGDENSINALEETLSSFYIPSFSLEIEDNYVIIRVFPRSGEEATVTISRLSGSTPEVISGAVASDDLPIQSSLEPVDLISSKDGSDAIVVKVDPLAHSNTTIKRPLADGKAMGLGEESVPEPWIDQYGYQPIETIYTTTFPSNPRSLLKPEQFENDDGTFEIQKTEENKVIDLQMHLQVLNKIVADQIKGMSDDVRKQLIDEYSSVVASLESLTELVTEIDKGQQQFLGLADPDVFLAGKFTPSSDASNGLRRHLSLSNVLAKILYKAAAVDLSNSDDTIGPLGLPIGDTEIKSLFDTDGIPSNAMLSHVGLHNGLKNDLSVIGETSWTLENKYYKQLLAGISNADNSVNLETVQEEVSEIPVQQASTIGEESLFSWYTSEMENLLTGEEKDSGAESWLSTFTETVESATKAIDWNCTTGEGFLVVQSIMNTLKEMAMDDCDVGSYVSQHEYGSNLELIGESSQLGVRDLRLFPNMSPEQADKAAEGEFDPPVHPTSADFVTFACLIKFLDKVLNAELDFHEGDDYSNFLINDVLGLGDSDRISAGNVYSIGELIKEFEPTYYTYSLNETENEIHGLFDYYVKQNNQMLQEGGVWNDAINEFWTGTDSAENLVGDSAGFSSYQALGVNWTKWTGDTTTAVSQVEEPAGFTTRAANVISETSEQRGSASVPHFGNVIFHTTVSTVTDETYPFEKDPELSYKTHQSSFFSAGAYRPKIILPMYTYTDTATQDRLMNESVFWDFSEEGSTFSSTPSNFHFGYDSSFRRFDNEFFAPGDGRTLSSIVPQGPAAGAPVVDYVKWAAWAGGGTDSSDSKWNSLTHPWGNHPDYDANVHFNRHPVLPIRFDIEATRDNIEEIDPENSLGHAQSNYENDGDGTFVQVQVMFGEYTKPPPNVSSAPENKQTFYQGQTARRERAGFLMNGAPIDSQGQAGQMGVPNVGSNGMYALPILWCRIYSSHNDAMKIQQEVSPDDANSKKYQMMELGTEATFTLRNEMVRKFYRSKGGGLIKFFSGLEGILKRLLVETNRKVMTGALESLGTNQFISDDLLGLGSVTNGSMLAGNFLNVLRGVVQYLHSEMKLDDYNIRVDFDGNVVLETIDAPSHTMAGNNTRHYQRILSNGSLGTKGNAHLAKSWVNFVAICSDYNRIQFDTVVPRSINAGSLLPAEIISRRSNPNAERNWGGGRNYVSISTRKGQRDPLDFTDFGEVSSNGLNSILDHYSRFISPYPGSSNNFYIESWLKTAVHTMQMRNVLNEVDTVFERFISFLKTLKISDSNKEAFDNGLFSLEDIQRSGQILDGIERNRNKYQAGGDGVGAYWKALAGNSNVNQLFTMYKNDDGDGLPPGKYFLTVIGVREEFIRDIKDSEQYSIQLDTETAGWYDGSGDAGIYIGQGHDQIDDTNNFARWTVWDGGTPRTNSIVITKKDWSFGGSASDVGPNATKNEWKQTWLDWLHLVKGIHLDESVFVKGVEQKYSEFLINNEEELFPWTKKDFDGDKPKKQLETMYNVSPWLFPENFFMDVFKAREFRHVIPILIRVPESTSTPDRALFELNTGMTFFQGNIKFKLIGPN